MLFISSTTFIKKDDTINFSNPIYHHITIVFKHISSSKASSLHIEIVSDVVKYGCQTVPKLVNKLVNANANNIIELHLKALTLTNNKVELILDK